MPKTTLTKEQALAELRHARSTLQSIEEELSMARDGQGRAAVAAQEAGATLTEIGEALGLSKQRAFDLIAASKA